MISPSTRDIDQKKKERVSFAVSLAMKGQWARAVDANHTILNDFPDDLETYNRLGKALSELGRNREARDAFQRALDLSPQNSIAKKNMERLSRLTDESSSAEGGGDESSTSSGRTFIEESSKVGVTSLTGLGTPEVLLKLAPGKPLKPESTEGGRRVSVLKRQEGAPVLLG